MKKPAKAVLLSAFVCPGAGQLYLKRYAMAAVLLLVTVVALVMVLVPAMAVANTIAERLVSGELQAGPELLGAVRAAATGATTSATPATLALLVAWIVGIVHAWYAGRQRDLT